MVGPRGDSVSGFRAAVVAGDDLGLTLFRGRRCPSCGDPEDDAVLAHECRADDALVAALDDAAPERLSRHWLTTHDGYHLVDGRTTATLLRVDPAIDDWLAAPIGPHGHRPLVWSRVPVVRMVAGQVEARGESCARCGRSSAAWLVDSDAPLGVHGSFGSLARTDVMTGFRSSRCPRLLASRDIVAAVHEIVFWGMAVLLRRDDREPDGATPQR